jgi:hypothetical protein
MPCYEVKWRETYEVKAVVSAGNYEAAMLKAAELEASAPSLDFFEEWKGDEAVTYTEVEGIRIEAELLDRQDPTCLPLGLAEPPASVEEENEKNQ